MMIIEQSLVWVTFYTQINVLTATSGLQGAQSDAQVINTTS